jgi:bilirubin oxidase
MVTRRQFLKLGAMAGAGVLLPLQGRARRSYAAIPGGTLDPTTLPKYAEPLVIPPAMPVTSATQDLDYYEIAVTQFQQQILPAGYPATTVWSYGSISHPTALNYPSFTIEAAHDKPVRVKWVNGLVDARGHFLPHLLPVDSTLHWANPPGGVQGRDSRPTFTSTPGPYTGPVPIVTHLHGGHTREESDGYPEAWYLPRARNIPRNFARSGTWYQSFKTKFQAGHHVAWRPGEAVFQYENDQPASTLWYHDHTLGMTRVNVYAGPAGFYIIRGGKFDLPTGLPGPAPALSDPPGRRYYEIPLAIQDRSFNADGSLFYPGSREFFDGFAGPYIPGSDISPLWNPEFFGNTMVVNGRTWPYLEVEPRRYRFRILNGCNGRFLILRLEAGLPFWQIGAEGGFLPVPVQLRELLIAPAERADVVVDFTALAGQTIRLLNFGPDEPFGGGVPGVDFEPADPESTGQVMEFKVILPLAGADTSLPPGQLTLPAPPKPGPATHTRQMSLNEEDSDVLPDVGPKAAVLGTLNAEGSAAVLGWDDPISENPAVGATEVWEIYNFTEDAHPIHIHEVQFEVVERQPFGRTARPHESWEAGLKDTVIAYPGEVTRVKALYDRPGRFVWHCHIVEHEDNEMMRPYQVG